MKTTHPFHQQAKWLQWIVSLVLLAVFMILFSQYSIAAAKRGYLYLLFPSLTPFMHFLMTPFLTMIGSFKYLSPMFLVYSASDKTYDVHNGTEWDYLWMMRGVPAGRPWQNRILAYHLQGLLEIIRRIEEKELPESVKITGTSYFFSENTAQRLGFEIKKPTLFYKFNQYINYMSLLWTYSFSKGHLAFPNLKNVKAAETTGARLVEKKAYIQKVYNYLKQSSTQL